MLVPFNDLRPSNYLQNELAQVCRKVIQSGRYILGPQVETFENTFAILCDVRYGVGVASGTDALTLSLMACGIGPGDEVITVPNTSVATVVAIERAGATPVLVDIDPVYYTMDASKLKEAITPRTKAIIPVHLYGCPAPMASILDIACCYNLVVVEDCAQAIGALYRDMPVGTWGDLGAFSFYPTKNLGACGDGGIVVMKTPELAERVKAFRQYGWVERDISSSSGINSRLDEIQAAILLVKMKYLRVWNYKRRVLAGIYTELLANSGVITPKGPKDCHHVYHLYVIRHPQREALAKYLRRRGIDTMVHYPMPIHLQPAYSYLYGNFPEAERASREILSLPLYPGMPFDDVYYVVQAIRDFKEQCA